jgi:hypothetical protein
MRTIIFIPCLILSLWCRITFGQQAKAQSIGGVTPVSTLAELKTKVGQPNSSIQLLGKTSAGDFMGSTYYWDDTSNEAEDTQYNNVVAVTGRAVGRWKKAFSRTMTYAQGIYTQVLGIKRFYVDGVTDANGEVTVNLTPENTANGTQIFTEIWSVNPQCNTNISNSNDVVIGARKSIGVNNKTVTCVFSRGNTNTLGATLLSIAGTVITGFRAAPAGTAVKIIVEGI